MDKYDAQKMYSIYDRWPEIAKKSWEAEIDAVNFDNINHIVFAGMGGSGAIGDVFASILSKSNIHVNVVKGYVLPKTVNSDTLVVVTSVSGDTAETLAILESAHSIGCRIVAFSSGGKMEKYCIQNNINHRVIPQYHSPRGSFTSFLYSILKVLCDTLGIAQDDVLESIIELEKIGKKINSLNLTGENPALGLSEW